MLGLLAVTTSLVLVVGQMPFANSAFEYGKVRSFEGVVVTQPFPTLLVARPVFIIFVGRAAMPFRLRFMIGPPRPSPASPLPPKPPA